MLTGKDLHTLNTAAALQIHQLTLNGWEKLDGESQRYYDLFAEFVNSHFTTSSTTQEPLASDIYETLTNMPEETQALVYRFLYRIGHRIYK